jgi:hypothetical protein
MITSTLLGDIGVALSRYVTILNIMDLGSN